jgi:DNA-binding transcriptional ArsR family regulator
MSQSSTKSEMPSQARPVPRELPTDSHRWTFLTNHTHVLVILDRSPEIVLREVAIRVGITERAVQRIIHDLEDGGFIERERVGRRNRYRVLRDEPLRHPIESHRPIGDLLDLMRSREE